MYLRFFTISISLESELFLTSFYVQNKISFHHSTVLFQVAFGSSESLADGLGEFMKQCRSAPTHLSFQIDSTSVIPELVNLLKIEGGGRGDKVRFGVL